MLSHPGRSQIAWSIQTVIIVDEFHKAYDRTIAVSGISFQVRPGEVLGLVGPNGAGKTTTLRALAGIIPSSGGALSIDGFDVDENPIEAKHRVAYVPDDPQLFQDLTVDEHLAFTASAYRVENASPIANQLLESFELTSKRDSPASDLSRGMRQKLALCCAYLHDPVALLLDEPMTGLDPRGIRTLKESISSRAAAGAAVIISSHLLAMVEDICSHVLIVEAGEQRFAGTVEQLRQKFAQGDRDLTLEDIFFEATTPLSNEDGAPDRQPVEAV